MTPSTPLHHRRMTFTCGLFLAMLAVLAGAVRADIGATGLSTLGAIRFHNEDLVGFDPAANEHFGQSFAVGDFNGDGADDLVTGIPDDKGVAGFETFSEGAAVVRYGHRASGLDPGLANQFLRQTPNLDPAEAGDNFGWSFAACDFNGDGWDDLAVGVPNEADDDRFSGAVNVYYGSEDGLGPAAAFYTEDTPGIPGSADFLDEFGWALACGDFDADGFADLAIGAPGKGVFYDLAGAVVIVPGSAAGLDPESSSSFNQWSDGIGDAPEYDDEFGSTLAAGDFNGDGFADLAIGVPFEDSSHDQEGLVHVLFGGGGGLTGVGSWYWNESGIGVSAEAYDRLGWSLAAGDFDGDGHDDLAIGMPYKDLHPDIFVTVSDAGMVGVLFGSSEGFDMARTQFWWQDNVAGFGTSEADDIFGNALAAGDFNGDGKDELAVGSRGEFISGVNDGVVVVLVGSETGLTNAGYGAIAEGYDGMPGPADQHDKWFGYAVAAGDFAGDGHADLAIGIPYEDENGLANVGMELVVYGPGSLLPFADGFESGGVTAWSAVH